MKIPFFSKDPKPEETVNTVTEIPKPPTFGEKLQQFMQHSSSVNYESKIAMLRPFAVVGAIAVPYWMFKTYAKKGEPFYGYMGRIPFFRRAPKPEEVKEVQEIPKPPTLYDNIRGMVETYKPKDLEDKMKTARPFVIASIVAWPMFWLYRGLNWGKQRNKEQLASYISRTFLHAKILQIAIISGGILAITYGKSLQLKPLSNEQKQNSSPKAKDGKYSDD